MERALLKAVCSFGSRRRRNGLVHFVQSAKRASGGLCVLTCLLGACGGLVFAGGALASARRVGVLTGGIYDVGGPAPPFGCYGKRCPVGKGLHVTVRNPRGVIVARTTLHRNGQKFRFTLAPGGYTVSASCGGTPTRKVHVFSGQATHANIDCGIR